MKTRNFKTMLTAIALTIAAPLAMAADSTTPTTHNPYTVLGVQLRSVLLADPANGSSGVSLGPAIFQEIVPCRFISTLEADRYPIEWGGPAYAANESRSYRPIGEMVSANFTNPCSLQVPVESLAVARTHELHGDAAAKFAASAYNAGLGGALTGLRRGNSDLETTGHDYGADVVARMHAFRRLERAERP